MQITLNWKRFEYVAVKINHIYGKIINKDLVSLVKAVMFVYVLNISKMYNTEMKNYLEEVFYE